MTEKPQWTQNIGRAYTEGHPVKNEDNAAYRNALDSMVSRNKELFADIPIPVKFQSEDPYSDFDDMQKTVEKEGILRIFSGGSPPEHMSIEENLQARAVHDWYGHLGYECDFTPKGEVTKWYMSEQLYDTEVTALLFAEVVAQVAAVHYVHGFTYQQRGMIAPSEWIESVCQHYDITPPEGTYYHE